MKNNKYSIFQLVYLIALILLQGCYSEDIEDPCRDEMPVSAYFTIQETFQLGMREEWRAYDTDSISSFYILFTATEKDAEYEWTLGDETIYEKSFVRYSFPRGTSIEVKLRVNKYAMSNCFPDDDGVDSLRRVFYLTENFYCDSKVKGQFIGRDSADINSERTVIIDPCYDYPDNPFNNTDIRIINLVPGCDIYGFGKQDVAYKQMYFGDNGTIECLNPIGLAYVFGTENDSIRINYSIKKSPNDTQNRINKIFLGIRKE